MYCHLSTDPPPAGEPRCVFGVCNGSGNCVGRYGRQCRKVLRSTRTRNPLGILGTKLKGEARAFSWSLASTRWSARVLFPPNLEGNVTKFAPHKALK